MKKHYQILVKGIVQGVGFRAFTQSEANKFGIKGRVKNELDGSVYIEAEGQEEILEKFIEGCQKGPLLSKVSEIKVQESNIQNYQSFEIDY